MHSDRLSNTYSKLREQPAWELLAATSGPIVIAVLQTHLGGEDRTLPSSIFHERIERDLEEMRGQGKNFPRSAQSYISDWLRHGYLERRFPEGSQEETYSISAPAMTAIRFASGLAEPRTAATESRLAVVIQQLSLLAQESNSDPRHRITALQLERDRITREIEEIESGSFKPLENDRALERIREIIYLANELSGDFKSVRSRFDDLNRELREQVIDHEGSRGQVLDKLFAGVNVIRDSDAGRTFAAFWRLLTDPNQSSLLEDSLDQILNRPFASNLSSDERRFLLRLTKILLEEGGNVHDVLQHFARSLRQFVQSSEYLEQRRLNQLLREAQKLGVSLKDNINTYDLLDYDLTLTSLRMKSFSQWCLFDPSLNSVPENMRDGEAAPFDLATVADWVSQSEIDFKELKENISLCLETNERISIAEIIDRFPVSQGLGSIVGYLTLANRFAVEAQGEEKISWRDSQSKIRHARIPIVYFTKERQNELE